MRKADDPGRPAVAFPGPREAAMEVNAAARNAGHGGLHPLPFNRFDADGSTWWLSPSTDNPAYRYGKIMLARLIDKRPELFVGLYVEKGISGPAAGPFLETPRGRRLVMDASWTWNHFARALRSGEIDQVARAAEAGSGVPVTIIVDAAPVAPPSGRAEDIHSPDLPRDIVRFTFSRGTLRREDAVLGAGVLQTTSSPENLAALAVSIAGVSQLDWIWVDFWAGLRFSLAREGDRGALWSAVDVWLKACYPWRAWIQ